MKLAKLKKPKQSFFLPTIITLFICSFFLPLFLIFILQDILFFSDEHWFFTAPPSAIYTFFIGLILIPISLTIYRLTLKFGKKFMKWITLSMILLSLPLFFLSVTNYYYMDDEGIHLNKLMSIQVTSYNWDDIKEVKEIYKMSMNEPTLVEYEFIMKNNEMIKIPYRLDHRKISDNLINIIDQYKIKVTSNKDELYSY
jgi:hypothetical protein